jgi:DNA-binding transcriptional MerR regulator
MRIREIATELRVSTTWLRRLERAGLVPPPARDRNGHRRYGPEDLVRLRRLIYVRGGARLRFGPKATMASGTDEDDEE